jgi:hypothetical protein
MGNDLTKGTTYVDGGMINAANLNAHVDDATFKSTAISARTAKTPMAVTDELLINDAGTLKKVSGSSLYDMTTQPGAVIQSTYGTYTANANITTVIPQDDTIPQNTEGTQIISLSFTPRFVNSKMVIRFDGGMSVGSTTGVVVAIFRDTAGVNAIAASVATVTTANYVMPISILAIDLPATIATVTYTVRAGPGAATTIRFNGTSAARFFGGVMVTTLEVQEVRVP